MRSSPPKTRSAPKDATASVQDYLAAIYDLQSSGKPVIGARFAKHMALAPIDFAMSYITRSGRVDLERLRRTSPAFVAAYEASRTG